MTSPDKPADVPAARLKRRIPLGYKIAGAILLLFLLPPAGVHLYCHFKINGELAAIRKAGYPVTLQELNDYYPVPQGENAAEIYYQAFAKFAGRSSEITLPVVGPLELPPRGDPLPNDMKTGISDYLTANAQALELLRKAAAMKDCRFDFDPSQDLDVPRYHLWEIRHAAFLLQLDALMKVEEGKPSEAATAVFASLAAVHSVFNEPAMFAQYVRWIDISIPVETLERVLSRTALADRQLKDLGTILASDDNSKALVRGLAGERCRVETIFAEGKWPSSELGGDGVGGILRNMDRVQRAYQVFRKLSGIRALLHMRYLRHMGKMVNVAGETARAMRDRIEKSREELLKTTKPDPLTVVLARTAAHYLEEELSFSALLRAARAGIAVERFRMANGRLPDSLDELVPKWLVAIPADPWDDKPIRYKKLTKGFVTYSVGPDLKDDGGKERDPKDYNATFDITFTIER